MLRQRSPATAAVLTAVPVSEATRPVELAPPSAAAAPAAGEELLAAGAAALARPVTSCSGGIAASRSASAGGRGGVSTQCAQQKNATFVTANASTSKRTAG